jgi:threonine dehydratase
VETLLGQGSVGLELENQYPWLDTLLVAVGGGGLIGGVAAWYSSRIRIVGVEPEAAPTLTRALQAGRPVDAEAGGIAADSLAPRRVGERMFPIAQSQVHSVLLVSDDAIDEAQRALWSAACGGRAGRSRSSCSVAVAALPAPARRAGGRPHLRREHHRGKASDNLT